MSVSEELIKKAMETDLTESEDKEEDKEDSSDDEKQRRRP